MKFSHSVILSATRGVLYSDLKPPTVTHYLHHQTVSSLSEMNLMPQCPNNLATNYATRPEI